MTTVVDMTILETTPDDLRPTGEGVLDRDEEQELARRIEAGVLAGAALDGLTLAVAASTEELWSLVRIGQAAQRRFVLANTGLVRSVSGPEARRSGLSEADLFQEGCVSLLRAIQAFDHRRGCRFSTFALPRIRAAVTVAAARRLGASELPGWRALALRRARGTEGRLTVELGRAPDPAEVARELDRSPDWTSDLLAHRAPVSLETLLAAGVDPAGPPHLDADDDLRLVEGLDELPALERSVLRWRFGFSDGRPRSRAATAEQLGLGRGQVREAEQRALLRLRGAMARG